MGLTPTLQDKATQRIVVGVGELASSNTPGAILSTYALGSCVGLIAYDPGGPRPVGVLLHAMLPDSKLAPEKGRAHPGMFVDTGMKQVFRTLSSLHVERSRLRIYLAGGASVLSQSEMFKIGETNVAAIKRILTSEGLRLSGEDTGGLNNRTVHFQLGSAQIEIKAPTGTRTIQLA